MDDEVEYAFIEGDVRPKPEVKPSTDVTVATQNQSDGEDTDETHEPTA